MSCCEHYNFILIRGYYGPWSVTCYQITTLGQNERVVLFFSPWVEATFKYQMLFSALGV